MNRSRARQVAKIVVPGLFAGGCIGLGVGLNLYGPVVGIVGSVLVGAFVCFSMLRLRANWRHSESKD
jgi:uncharacterized membrane protein